MRKAMWMVAVLFLSVPAGANNFVTRARVLESNPIVETVYEQYEECSYKTVTTRATQRARTEDKIIGGLLGGAAGSALGKGSGRDAAAGVGVLLGSEIAADDGGLSEGELIGGLAGGIIGNQVGGGSGKTAATGAGVLLGAIIGDTLQNGGQQNGVAKKRRVCEKKERSKKIISGYDVVFEYSGVRATGVLPYEPGDYVDISVGVELVENRTSQARN